MNITFRSMRIFCDIVDQRSFSRAADVNGISQSGASQVVHHLEELLGVQLLDRSKRPFVLTSEGEHYYAGCRQLIKQHSALEEEVRSLHDETARSLVVASIYSVGLAHMSAFMRRFSAKYPSAHVRLEYLHPDRVVEVVEQGEVDFGLVSYPEESRSLAAIAWRSEPLILVCYPGHPLAGRDSVAIEELSGESFIAFEAGLRIRSEIDRVLFVRKANVSVTLEFDNIETIKRAIEINAGVSILPEPTVEREIASGTLTQVAIQGNPMERPLGILHRTDLVLSPIAKQFIDLLQADTEFACLHEVTTNGSPNHHQDQKNLPQMR